MCDIVKLILAHFGEGSLSDISSLQSITDLGLNPDDLNLVNASIVIIFIAYNNLLPEFMNKKDKGVKSHFNN